MSIVAQSTEFWNYFWLGKEVCVIKENSGHIINHIPEDNFLFSVLETENDSFYEAIMEHFFEISYFYKSWGNFVTFNFEDITNWNSFNGLETIYMAQNYLDLTYSFSRAEKLLKHFLQRGYSLLVPIDKYYIKAYHCHEKHYSHTLYIMNMEENNEALYCQDYFDGNYKKILVPKEEIISAMCNYKNTYNEQWKGQDTGLVAIKKKEGYVYRFRPRVFLNRFQSMLYSEYDFDTPSFGIGLFDAIIETHTNDVMYWRPSGTRVFYQFISDNVELIKSRLSYLCRINNVFDVKDFKTQCEQIQNFCIIQRNKLLKYEIIHEFKLIVDKSEDIQQMADSLIFIKMKFQKLVNEIICEVRRSFFKM